MALRSKASGFLLVIVLAAVGFGLVYLPSKIVENYRSISDLGTVWQYLYLGVVGLGAVLLLGSTLWIAWRLYSNTLSKRRRKERRAKNPSQMSAAEREAEIRHNLETARELGSDQAAEVRKEVEPLVEHIESKSENQALEIVAFGTISSGKSSLMNALAGRDVFKTDLKGGTTVNRNEIAWPGQDRVTLVDTPGLGEVDGEERHAVAADAAEDADLVLLVVDGPLRQTEFELLEKLAEMEKRVVVCLNKHDWYDQDERDSLVSQISEQVGNLIHKDDVVTVQSGPVKRTRVHVLPDGRQEEEQVDMPADITPLAERLIRIVKRDGRELLLANLLLQSRGLLDEAKQRVKDALDQRAWNIVDKYMWSAGGAAALSPLPVVDLAAGCAISTKMVIELSKVYRQNLDASMAVELIGQQGKTLIGVVGSTAATPAVTSVVASMLKTVPGIGTVAGGFLQGIVQALVTRWIGGIFIRYFKDEMREPPGGLAELARQQWKEMTRPAELRKLYQTARTRLFTKANAEEEE